MKEVKDFYDHYAVRQISRSVHRRHLKIMDHIIDLGLGSKDNVLELGCGIGTLSSLVIQFLKEGELTCIDISEKSIAHAKQVFSEKTNIAFLAHDITERLSFDKKFDFILFPDVLEHIPQDKLEKTLVNSFYYLKDDGKIIINTPSFYYLEHLIANNDKKLQIIENPVYLSVIDEICRKNEFYIDYFINYKIWNECKDSQLIVIQKRRPVNSYKSIPYKKESLISNLFNKLNFKYKKFKVRQL